VVNLNVKENQKIKNEQLKGISIFWRKTQIGDKEKLRQSKKDEQHSPPPPPLRR
jgi:hypothetical protein